MTRFVIVFCLLSANALAGNKKEITQIILGSNGIINQEYNPFLQKMYKEGYKINVYSFDPMFANVDDHGIDLITKMRKPDGSLLSGDYSYINHELYSFDESLLKKYQNKNNKINLFRYPYKVSINNKYGKKIRNIFSEAVKNQHTVIFIDAAMCYTMQEITLELFNKYKDKAIFIHTTHDFVNPITSKLVNHNSSKVINGSFGCNKKMSEYYNKFISEYKSIGKIISDKKNYSELSEDDKKTIKQFFKDQNPLRNNLGDFEQTYVSEALKNSPFSIIDEKVIHAYYNNRT